MKFFKINMKQRFYFSRYIFLILIFILLVLNQRSRDPNFHSRGWQDKLQITKDYHISNALRSSVKILCLINSSKKELLNRAIHVNATWAQRCNKHVFLAYQNNISLPMLDLKVPEKRTLLWDKWRAAFKWAYSNELENFDYFLRADDDSYFVMENLRFMLLPYNPNKALIFGCQLEIPVKSGYMAGGSGVVLSREAMKQIVPAFENPEICPEMQPWDQKGIDDVELGACAETLKIPNVDTRDIYGRHRFLYMSPIDHFTIGLQPVHINNLHYPYKNEDCCSENIISLHYVYKEQIHAFEFLFYNVSVIGIQKNKLLENVEKENTNIFLIEKLKYASRKFNIDSTFIN